MIYQATRFFWLFQLAYEAALASQFSIFALHTRPKWITVSALSMKVNGQHPNYVWYTRPPGSFGCLYWPTVPTRAALAFWISRFPPHTPKVDYGLRIVDDVNLLSAGQHSNHVWYTRLPGSFGCFNWPTVPTRAALAFKLLLFASHTPKMDYGLRIVDADNISREPTSLASGFFCKLRDLQLSRGCIHSSASFRQQTISRIGEHFS